VIAYQYLLGGATCLSVLTDEHFFFGHLDHLRRVHAAVPVPILRKDFIIDERQVAEARLAGADAVLLIVACLEDGVLRDLQGFARELGLDVLVEVHDATEAARAVRLGADPVGVNNRNLRDFQVDLDTTVQLLPGLRGDGRVLVSESGIATRDDCRRLEETGVDAALVGEALMTAKDPVAALRRMCGQML
jgi:indole-3-glycerol phosphate synthase